MENRNRIRWKTVSFLFRLVLCSVPNDIDQKMYKWRWTELFSHNRKASTLNSQMISLATATHSETIHKTMASLIHNHKLQMFITNKWSSEMASFFWHSKCSKWQTEIRWWYPMVSFSKWHYRLQNSIIKLNKGNDNAKESPSFTLRTTYGKEFFSIEVSISFIYASNICRMKNWKMENAEAKDIHLVGFLI